LDKNWDGEREICQQDTTVNYGAVIDNFARDLDSAVYGFHTRAINSVARGCPRNDDDGSMRKQHNGDNETSRRVADGLVNENKQN